MTQAPGDARRIAGLQLATMLVAAAVAHWIGGPKLAIAALFGAAVALLATLVLILRTRRALRQVLTEPHRMLRSFYFASAERFAIVVVGMAVGIKAFALDPLALIAGFIAGQLIWIAFAFTRQTQHEHG